MNQDQPLSQRAQSILQTSLGTTVPLILFVLAFVVRLIGIEQNSLWGDELAQAVVAKGTIWQVIVDAVQHTGGAPLDYLISHFTLRFLGRSEGILRLPDVLWGSLTVVLIFYTGRRLFSPAVGFLAALLLLIMPLHVEYSREMRFYVLPTLLILASVYVLLQAVSRPRWHWWAAYGLIALLALYTHFYATIALGLEGFWVIIFYWRQRGIVLRLVVTGLFVLLLFLPWAVYFFSHPLLPPNLSWYNYPSFSEVLTAPFFDPFPGGNYAAKVGTDSGMLLSTYISYTRCMMILMAVYASVLVLGLYITTRRATSKVFVSHLTLLFILTFAGMTTSFLLSSLTRYFFAPRQFLFFTPFLLLAASTIVCRVLYEVSTTRALQRYRELVVIAGVVAFALFNLWVLWSPLTDLYTPYKQDWRGASRFLLHTMQPQDVLLTDFREYVSFYAPELSMQIEDGISIETAQLLSATHSNTWILATRGGLFPKLSDQMEQWLTQHHAVKVSETADFVLYRVPNENPNTF